MGFNAWKDPEIGRSVKAGEKGIRIIAPSPFKVKKEVEKIDPDTKKPVVDKDGKRCIAGPGQLVDIDEEGNVYVDDVLLEEPYRTEKALGDCNIELPYQVPENRFFFDRRSSCYIRRQPEHGSRMRGGGTDCRQDCISCLAA